MVYFISDGAGYIKIGRAGDPAKRLAALQTSTPHSLTIIATVDESVFSEKQIHDRFAHWRVRGEWFHDHEAIRAFAAAYGDLSPNVPPHFRELAAIEPRILALYNEARQIIDDPSEPGFCANYTFFQYHNRELGFKYRLSRLVGWNAEGNDPRLHTETAYDVVYETIYEVLPNCRNCSCYPM